jgi:formate dehydrogenase major subunit
MALWDVANADVITVMGSNMAENHPVAFRFVTEAQQRGATVIHVDPRFTRTSALANIHAPIRSGTDIAFLGGLIRYILVEDKWFKEFALAYTNIATIIEDGFADAEDGDGVFSGYQEASASYVQDTWQYKGEMVPPAIAEHYVHVENDSEGRKAELTWHPPPRDPTLQHPNCVYQIMRRHYARYTPDMVERVTGCAKDTFLRICDAITHNSGRERTGAFCYAVGWTHHSYGVQTIRAASIIQGLLGNIGRPGGGILALRGHCSIQGSTDIPTLYNMLPTYLPQPNAFNPHHTLEEFLATETVPTGWWNNLPKYMVSLLKAWYGAHAQTGNGFCYDYLPKLTGDHSQLPMTLAMIEGVVKGQFVLGQNPVVGAVNSELVQRGLARLEWLVVRDFAMTETANFWLKGGIVQSGELSPQQIGTEVFFLPSAMAAEKEGTMTNTTRLVQWHDRVCDPPGDSRSDLWFIYHLGSRLKELYAGSEEPRDAPVRALTWEYPVNGGIAEPDAASVLREVNGYTVTDRKQLKSFQQIKDDGSTACGGWMYCGIFPDQHDNRSRARRLTARTTTARIRAGRSHGRTIVARCTTGHRLTWTGSPGRSASAWYGGTRSMRNGPATTRRISFRPSVRICVPIGTGSRMAWTRTAGMIRSSWKPTASACCSCHRG